MIFPFAADGNPIANGYEILDQDASSGKPRLWPLIVLFTGGFHLLIELLNKKGQLTEEFTRYIVSLYRKSRGKQDWVISPRDPNQAEDECIPSQMAHYRAAADDELAEFSTVIGARGATHIQRLVIVAKNPKIGTLYSN